MIMSIELFDDFFSMPKEKQKIIFFNQKPYKGLYRTFIPKKIRLQKLQQAELTHQEYLAKCWDKVISVYFSGKFPKIEIKAKKQLNTQKVIWQYWGQGINNKLPDVVTMSFNSVNMHKGDYTVIRLDNGNIHDYLEIPDFIEKKARVFKPAFFSDILRLALLNNYGGIWIDATILLTATIDNNISEKSFFMFQRDKNADRKDFWVSHNSKYFNWHDRHFVNVMNSFIVADKQNLVVQHCLNIMLNFWKNSHSIPHYFLFQIMFDVLIKNYLKNDNCEILDDTLPHLLASELHNTFDKDKFNQITDTISIHKLTYTTEVPDNCFFDFLKNVYG